MKDTCCACTSKASAAIKDGAYLKPVCPTHERLYAEQGFEVVKR